MSKYIYNYITDNNFSILSEEIFNFLKEAKYDLVLQNLAGVEVHRSIHNPNEIHVDMCLINSSGNKYGNTLLIINEEQVTFFFGKLNIDDQNKLMRILTSRDLKIKLLLGLNEEK